MVHLMLIKALVKNGNSTAHTHGMALDLTNMEIKKRRSAVAVCRRNAGGTDQPRTTAVTREQAATEIIKRSLKIMPGKEMQTPTKRE